MVVWRPGNFVKMRQIAFLVGEKVVLSGVASGSVIQERFIHSGRRFSRELCPLRGRSLSTTSLRTRGYTVCALNIVNTCLSVDIRNRARRVLRHGSLHCLQKKWLAAYCGMDRHNAAKI